MNWLDDTFRRTEASAPMKSPRSLTVACFFFFLLAFSTAAQTTKITAAEAKDHVGEVRTVCGKVVSTHYASGSKGQPTFLNLDEPYPKEDFTILIWGSDRAKFGTPETKYKDARVCVTGKITSYRGKPEIIATEPSQIVQEK
jgi:DNA/RNA endonuclease YhcR with UshA esterase domain